MARLIDTHLTTFTAIRPSMAGPVWTDARVATNPAPDAAHGNAHVGALVARYARC